MVPPRTAVALAAVVVLALGGCAGDAPPEAVDPTAPEGLAFQAPDGTFTVEFPGPPRQSRFTRPDGLSDSTYSFAPGDRVFLVIVTTRPSSDTFEEWRRRTADDVFAGPGDVRDTELQGRAGIEFAVPVEAGGGAYIGRAFATSGAGYQIAVSVAGEDELDAEGRRFLDSFRFTDPAG